MNKIKSNTSHLIFIISVIVFLFLEIILKEQPSSNWFLIIIFWLSIAEGCIALVAASELANSKWIPLLKKKLLSLYPLILFIAIFFLIFSWSLSIHPAINNYSFWLSKQFFIIRNFIVLLLVFYLARRYSQESLTETNKKKIYASFYLLSFVVSQSLVAFDWIMPLEYPWYSTLFGGYTFIESFYSGIAIGGILFFSLSKLVNPENKIKIIEGMANLATLMFGFSLLWVGLFYAQFLVIWYGNIPEETHFILRRISFPIGKNLGLSILIFLFFVPFLLLLPQSFKRKRIVVLSISILIIAGIFVERFLYLLPLLKFNLINLSIEFFLFFILFAEIIRR